MDAQYLTERRVSLESFFPYRLAVAAEIFSRNLMEVYGRAFGLTREEWRLLFLLQGGEPITSLELARRTTLDKVQVSRAAQRLEAKGLITRQIAETDRRLRIYRCTAAGHELFAQALPQVEARAREMLEAMPAGDRRALEHGVSALIRTLSDEADGRGSFEVEPVD